MPSGISWQYPVIPLRERFIKDNPHLLFDIGSDFPTRCIHFVEHAHTDG